MYAAIRNALLRTELLNVNTINTNRIIRTATPAIKNTVPRPRAKSGPTDDL